MTKPERDSSIEEESCFQESKIIPRTLTKGQRNVTYKEITGGVEETTAMFADIKGELANIKEIKKMSRQNGKVTMKK